MKIGARMLIPNRDLDFRNFNPKIHFWANLGPKIRKCLFCLKNGTYGILRMLILIPLLLFWVSNPNLLFGKKLGQKRRGCLLYLRIGTHVISRLLIVFWISKPKSIFGQIWTEKITVVQFGWKLTYRLSRRCWFLFQDYCSQCQTLNPFSAKIKVVHFDWKLADSYWDNTFLNCQP